MKAAQISDFGGEEVMKINTIADPSPKEGQVLVDVFDAAVNPFDYKLSTGRTGIKLSFPATMGGDFCGVVRGSGEEVYGQAHILTGGSGAFAEVAAVNSKNISRMPTNIDHFQAAALPLAGVSAIQALTEHANLQSGQKILIHGGAGGIGSFAIQIAKDIGAHVATTASASDKDYVKNLGADEIIDYKNQKFEEILKDYDAVFDTVGGEIFKRSFKVLKKDGILVSMLEGNEELAKEYGVKVFTQQTGITTERLAKLTALVEKGKFKINVDKVFSLDETAKALTYLEKGSPKGKVVIKIKV